MSIVTLTMNPAMDIAASTAVVRPTDKMRCTTPRFDPGGGGINVARTVVALGESVTAVFPIGGPEGIQLAELVRVTGVPMRTVSVSEPTRQSLSVTDESCGAQYRFVFPGPRLSSAEQHRCLVEVERAAGAARLVVASGSLPPGVPDDFYQRLADLLGELDIPLIVDTAGAPLHALRRGIRLLKPSVRELSDLVGHALPDRGSQLAAARDLIVNGVTEIVVLSLGSAGALLVTAENEEYFAPIRSTVASGIGAGDAMVGGLAVGLLREYALGDAVRLGIAAATAALATPGTQPGEPGRITELFGTLTAPERSGVWT
ncbi:1-phosphofructokinase family hexose kinase [Nocardia sp. NBC_01503]|uniref:1-phosphofructokinase family hexose kinase n=1 Tax=Nocardia sp. NBC_01503 TaxID=2975997 RepID=UPI002E7B2CD8|nr:1-phosphofructokinase family hexose kinase [Nocardia sp. NBC_01503]WTL31067.1 1-phosphofructokinase family hexose kinase [Nocardia sp. NBC_01503]